MDCTNEARLFRIMGKSNIYCSCLRFFVLGVNILAKPCSLLHQCSLEHIHINISSVVQLMLGQDGSSCSCCFAYSKTVWHDSRGALGFSVGGDGTSSNEHI